MSLIAEPITNDVAMNIALGRYEQKIVKFLKFAKIPNDVGLGSTWQDVWTRSHLLTYATSGESLYIWSSDESDTMECFIAGLDGNGYYQEKTVTLSGATAVLIDGTWLRIFRITPLGSTINLGQITISTSSTGTSTDGQIRGHAVAGDSIANFSGHTFMSHFTVPKGYIGLVDKYLTVTPGNADIFFQFLYRKDGLTFVPVDQTGSTLFRNLGNIAFDELTDIKVMAKATATTNRDIPISYTFRLVEKAYYDEAMTKPKTASQFGV